VCTSLERFYESAVQAVLSPPSPEFVGVHTSSHPEQPEPRCGAVRHDGQPAPGSQKDLGGEVRGLGGRQAAAGVGADVRPVIVEEEAEAVAGLVAGHAR
jgi:hypothetical protein